MNCKICNGVLNPDGSCPSCGWQMPVDTGDMPTVMISRDSSASMKDNMKANMQGYKPDTNVNLQMQQQPINSQMYQQPVNSQMYQQPVNSQMYQQNNSMPGYSAPPASAPPASAPPKKKSKAPVIISIITVIAVIAGVIIAIILSGKEKDLTGRDTTEKPSTTEEKTTTSTTETTTEIISTGEPGTKTIMIYMVGSNLESDYQAATSDLEEMLYSGYDESMTNILVYTGGCKDWYESSIPDDQNAAFIISDGALEELYTEPQRNMGDPSTLSDFINYCYENYPAEEYSVILWNHGGGAFFGYGLDEITEDMLTLSELRTAFSSTSFNENNKLSWIGFDACLMANIETAKVLSPYANYLIASQESEPGWGWDYEFLSDIDNYSGGDEIGKVIVDEYISCSEDSFAYNPFSYCDVTMSVLDLNQIAPVEEALNTMFKTANDQMDDYYFARYSKIRKSTKELATMFQGEESYDIVDMVDLSRKSMETLPTEASALETALNDFVVYSDSNAENIGGVSIYYPYNAKEYSTYYLAMYGDFDFAPDYHQYITNFASRLTDTTSIIAQWDAATMLPYMIDDTRFAMDLTTEQVAAYQNSYYVISRADMDNPGKLMFVSMNSNTELNTAGTLQANYDGNIIYIQNETTGEYCEVMYTLQEHTDTYTRYLLSCILYNDTIDEENAMYTYLVLEVTPDNPSGTILGAYPIANLVYSTDGNYMFPDRYEVDINDYNYIAFGSFSHEFTSTEDLNEFNENQWSDLMLTYTTMPVSDGFTTVMDGMLDGIPYYGMFVIEDTQGNYHYSNLVQIK